MGRKILLVEDDRETASYLAKGLTQEGHSVEQATNGQDGLFRATDGSFDLIILDRMLPVLDGLSVLRALRAAHIETPVLVLSALASVGDRIEGLECGSDDYFMKPLSFAELKARANALLRRRESRVDPADHRLTVGDIVWTTSGNPNQSGQSPLTIVSHNGFDVVNASAINGGSPYHRE